MEYYEWELNIQGEERALISAAVSGGGLYVFAANATTEQYEAFPQEIAHIASSFSVVPTEVRRCTQCSNSALPSCTAFVLILRPCVACLPAYNSRSKSDAYSGKH